MRKESVKPDFSKCPKCGGRVVESILTRNPPIYITKCTKCDWENRYDPIREKP